MTNPSRLESLLALAHPPIAIAFRDAPPPGVDRAPVGAASCSYWARAAAGELFYTLPADHLGCAVGAFTHGAPMDDPKRSELEGLVGTMISLEYIAADEVAALPHRAPGFGAVVYGPLDRFVERVGDPIDVVLVRGGAKQLMLLTEAAQRAGAVGDAPMMGRPTCAVLPQAIADGRTAGSFGCVGNRVYTGATESEAYLAIPGARLAAIEEKLPVIVRANEELLRFHQKRLADLAPA